MNPQRMNTSDHSDPLELARMAVFNDLFRNGLSAPNFDVNSIWRSERVWPAGLVHRSVPVCGPRCMSGCPQLVEFFQNALSEYDIADDANCSNFDQLSRHV